jgi:DNA polymerase-4
MARWPRVILHADMDAFYAAVEQRDRPDLRGRPVVVGGLGKRGVVSTASYEARPFGVHSAMPMAEARRLCPGAVFLAPDFPKYEAESAKIREVFHRFSPLVEPLSLDEAFLDMTGAEGLFGDPQEMGAALQRAVWEATGLTVSVGVAPCKFVAKVASDFRKPSGLTVVPPEEVRRFLAPLDAGRLWGVGPKTRLRLAALGFRTIGDLAAAPEERLASLLGKAGRELHRLALGEDPRPVVGEREALSIGAEETFEEDLQGVEALLPSLRRAAERVATHLRREGLVASGIRVKIRTARFALHTRQVLLPRPADTWEVLFAEGRRLLERFELKEPVRLCGMATYRLEPRNHPRLGSLFEEEERDRRRKAEEAVDALRDRFGPSSIRWGGTDDRNRR